MTPTHLINGQTGDSLPVDDRGLSYGDGVFETMAVRHGRIPLWERHIDRLVAGCRRLGFNPGATPGELAQERDRLIVGTNSAVIRLTVTRGRGERGYRPPAISSPTRILSLYPAMQVPDTYRDTGVAVTVCRTRLARNPALAGIKHLNRLEQVLARAEWADEYEEGLMLDDRDRVIAATAANLFVVMEDRLVTPLLDECGVHGIMRDAILRHAAEQGVTICEQDLDLEQVQAAQEVFLCNSVRGIWPVRQIGGQAFSVGKLTRMLQQHVDTILC